MKKACATQKRLRHYRTSDKKPNTSGIMLDFGLFWYIYSCNYGMITE